MRLRLGGHGSDAPVAPADDGDAALVPREGAELEAAELSHSHRPRRRASPTLKQQTRAVRKLEKAWRKYKAVHRPRRHAAERIQRVGTAVIARLDKVLYSTGSTPPAPHTSHPLPFSQA